MLKFSTFVPTTLLLTFILYYMKGIYLKLVGLTALSAAILSGCASKSNETSGSATVDSGSESSKLVGEEYDWNTPLYELEANGDTSSKYVYRADGKLINYYLYYEKAITSSYNYEYDGNGNLVTKNFYYSGELNGFEKWKYDSQNRVIAYEYSGESDECSSSYTYEGNKRIESSNEQLSESAFKKTIETYFDAEGNDTLIVKRSACIREHTDAEYNNSATPDITTTRKTYVTINGVKKIKSLVELKGTSLPSKKEDFNLENATKAILGLIHRVEDYEYDDLGRVTKYEYTQFSNGEPAVNEKNTFTYSDGYRTDKNGLKTYYKKK